MPGGGRLSPVPTWRTVSHANISSAAHVTTVCKRLTTPSLSEDTTRELPWELGFGSSGVDRGIAGDKVARD